MAVYEVQDGTERIRIKISRCHDFETVQRIRWTPGTWPRWAHRQSISPKAFLEVALFCTRRSFSMLDGQYFSVCTVSHNRPVFSSRWVRLLSVLDLSQHLSDMVHLALRWLQFF